MNKFPLTIISIPDDIISSIVSKLSIVDSHNLCTTNIKFRSIAKYDTRALTVRKIFSTKNITQIKDVEEITGKKINILKHFLKIVNTNDIHIVSHFIPDPNDILYITISHIKHIITNLSAELVYYLLSCNLDHRNKNLILENNRIDIIEYYASKNTNIFDSCAFRHINSETVFNFDFLKYIRDKGYVVTMSDFIKGIMINDLDYVKWTYSKLRKLSVSYAIHNNKEVLISKISNGQIKKEIVWWLHNQGHNIYPEIYRLASHNEALHLINLVDITKDDPTIPNRRLILQDAENNKFNTVLISNYEGTDIIPDLIYYIVKHKREDLYSLEIFGKNGISESEIVICSMGKIECVADFRDITIVSDYSKFILKYMDIIVKQNNMDVLIMIFKKYHCDLYIILEFHRRGMTNVCHMLYDWNSVPCVIGTTVYEGGLQMNKDLIQKDHIIYVCESDDCFLIKLLYFKNYITIEQIVKYCSVKIVLELFDAINKKFYSEINIDFITRYGNLEVVKEYFKQNKPTKYSIFYGFLNSYAVGAYVAKMSFYDNFRLMDYHLNIDINDSTKQNPVITKEINEIKNKLTYLEKKYIKKFLQTIIVNKINEYYKLIVLIKSRSSKTCSFDDSDINKIIEQDIQPFCKYILNKSEITKVQICQMIYNKSVNILNHVGSVGKLFIPFCHKSKNLLFDNSVQNIFDIILNYGCNCTDVIHDIINKTNIETVILFLEIYISHFKMLESNNCINNHIHTNPICSSEKQFRSYQYRVLLENEKYIIDKIDISHDIYKRDDIVDMRELTECVDYSDYVDYDYEDCDYEDLCQQSDELDESYADNSHDTDNSY